MQEQKPITSSAEYLGDAHKYFVSLGKAYAVPASTPRPEQLPLSVRVTEGSVGDKKKLRTISIDARADRKTLAASLDGQRWVALLSLGDGWWRALLTATHVARGRRRLPNQVKQLFTYRPGQTIHITYDDHTDPPTVEEVRLLLPYHHDAGGQSDMKTQSESKEQLDAAPQDTKEMLHLKLESGSKLCMTLHHYLSGARREPLRLHYAYHPEQGWCPIHEMPQGLYARLRTFYSSLWLPSAGPASAQSDAPALPESQSILSTRFRHSYVISRSDIQLFCQAVGRPSYSLGRSEEKLKAPVDFAIVIAWESLIKPLFFEVSKLELPFLFLFLGVCLLCHSLIGIIELGWGFVAVGSFEQWL